MAKSPGKITQNAPAAKPQAAADFVVKELQTSADDAIKLAYGSMTLPPQQFIQMFSKVGEEYLKFVAKRMQAQAGLINTLSQCNTVEEMAKIEMTFFGKAAQDYAEQFDRMAETTHDVASTAKSDGGKPA